MDIKPRRQDPSRDFVNVWQEIGQQRVYVPSKQDVGRILKLECTPVSQNGLYTGKSVSVESAEVMQAPPQAPVRNMIQVPQPPNAFDPRAPKATFKVMTYNCLADIYATPQVAARISPQPPKPSLACVRAAVRVACLLVFCLREALPAVCVAPQAPGDEAVAARACSADLPIHAAVGPAVELPEAQPAARDAHVQGRHHGAAGDPSRPLEGVPRARARGRRLPGRL
jgi:hypothetical protein